MDLLLSRETIYQLMPRVDVSTARQRVEDRKLTLVAGVLGALIVRPKVETIRLVATESRLEPFWHVTARVQTCYERPWAITVPVADADIRSVSLLGHEVPVSGTSGSGYGVALSGIERCEKHQWLVETYDRLGNPQAELGKLVGASREPVPSLAAFAPPGIVVVPPEVPEVGIISRMLRAVERPERASSVGLQQVEVETVALYFRPVYAFEFSWARRPQNVVIEFNGMTGDMCAGKLAGPQARPAAVPEVLFDVSLHSLQVALGTLGAAALYGGLRVSMKAGE